MSDSQMLQGKRAVIFGARGSIGAAVASEFAAEGAEVFLAGRTRSNVEAVAQRIGKAGHRAHAAVIDALDDAAVNTYIDGVVGNAGQIDNVFTAVGRRMSTATPNMPRTSRLTNSCCHSQRS